MPDWRLIEQIKKQQPQCHSKERTTTEPSKANPNTALDSFYLCGKRKYSLIFVARLK